jgi:hypothetical protein
MMSAEIIPFPERQTVVQKLMAAEGELYRAAEEADGDAAKALWDIIELLQLVIIRIST